MNDFIIETFSDLCQKYDNPYIITIGDKNVITSGIWDIRIL